MKHPFLKYFFILSYLALLPACPGLQNTVGPEEEESDPPAISTGERLFLETRFAQFFQAHSGSQFNQPLASGDPVMDTTPTLAGPLPGPFSGKSMNCRACHLVDEQLNVLGGGMRAYTDFARRSPISERGDGKTLTPRNSPPLVNSTFFRDIPLFLHFDGEFASIEDLAKGTLTGRNFGWLATEKDQALAHIAKVIREDDGTGELAQNFGGLPYKAVLLSEDLSIPNKFRLPKAFRMDVDQASDEEIVNAVAKLIGAYVDDLKFSQSRQEFNASPFDFFLEKNGLPRIPDEGESSLDYSRRLLSLVTQLESPQFVSSLDGAFQFHSQDFVFGLKELEGLKIFFTEGAQKPLSPAEIVQGKIGNCITCHAAPTFTDFKFHNTGITQSEYDTLFGPTAFAGLMIPNLPDRNLNPDAYLPPTANHPNGTGVFLDIPSLANPGRTDLGLWNVFANQDVPIPQEALMTVLCEEFADQITTCAPEEILPLIIAYFKTAGLRDLGHSAPYFHNGQKDALEDVIRHYIEFSSLARAGSMRNPSEEMALVALTENDVEALAAFLRSLNEDYN